MNHMSRRRLLVSGGATLAGAVVRTEAQTKATSAPQACPAPLSPSSPQPTADQIRRFKWWREARYGLFIHYGLYSLHARQEWAVEKEAIPWPNYERLAREFSPKPGFANEWVRIAQASGARYMVVTAKHHEGFCNFNTKHTDFNSVKQGPKRDIVREYVE